MKIVTQMSEEEGVFDFFVVSGLGPDMQTLDGKPGFFDMNVLYMPSVLDQYPPPTTLPSLQINFAVTEWRAIGVQQSRGWVHYAIHRPEPHIMLFRRPLNYQAP